METRIRVNRIGTRYGRLLVTSQAPSKHGYARWWCLCDCGKTKNVSGTCLQQGRIKSCGCLRRETCTIRATLNSEINTLSKGEAAFNQLYATYRNNATIKGRDFTLTKEQFKSLTESPCEYCGDGPKSICKSSTEKTGALLYNGVDRVDNTLGYTLENCVACCKVCNWMKRVQTQEEFYISCCKVAKYFENHKKSAEMTDSIII